MKSFPYISPNLSRIMCGCVQNTLADAAKKTPAYLSQPGREPRSPGFMISLLQGPTTLSTRPYTGYTLPLGHIPVIFRNISKSITFL